MKFTTLAIGQRFLLEDKEFTKISPLMGAPSDGGPQRLIPRSAPVTPVGDHPPPASLPSEISVKALDTAMQQLTGEVTRIIADSDLDPVQAGRLSSELQAAFLKARHSLGLLP